MNQKRKKVDIAENMDNRSFYIPLKRKFIIGHLLALCWMLFSIYLSIPWLIDLSAYVTIGGAVFIVGGIAYVPGYINAFNVFSLLLDRQPPFRKNQNIEAITILISCKNEEKGISDTLTYIVNQSYNLNIHVIVIDNNSTDRTYDVAKQHAVSIGLRATILKEKKPGKNFALNKALKYVRTPYCITLDADTLLHRDALKYLIQRMESAPDGVAAIAGAVLVRNSRENFLTKLQEWDYFLGIASIKRLQGLYLNTLVAQGAFSLYDTKAVRDIGGWYDAIGEDIVLTWTLLANGKRVIFEPNALAFTDVPTTLHHLHLQRSRWSRGMIEALKLTKPWQQPTFYGKYLTGINLIMPYLDICFTLFFIPGMIMACFGNYAIAGPLTLLLLPLALLQNYILYRFQRQVFKNLGVRIRQNVFGLFVYVLFYQMIMSPMSLWGYIQELGHFRRTWK